MIRFKCPRCGAACQSDGNPSENAVTCNACGHAVRIAMPQNSASSEPPSVKKAVPVPRDVDDPVAEFEVTSDSPRGNSKIGGAGPNGARDFVASALKFPGIVIRVLALLRAGAWMICGFLILMQLSDYSHNYARADTAIRQAVAASDACAGLIATYALTRVVHSITLAAETIFRNSP